MKIEDIIKSQDYETYLKLNEMRGVNKMGQHTKSDREKRKRKYAEQFARTKANKERRAKKRERKFTKEK